MAEMAPMPLISGADVARFHDRGYLVLRSALTEVEVRQLCDEVDSTTARAPLLPDQGRVETVDAPLHTLQTPFASGLATDQRIAGVAEAVFGDCFGLGCNANRYAGNTRWRAHPSSVLLWTQLRPARGQIATTSRR